MRLLDRYLLRELLVPLVYCLVGFLLFWISFDLLGELDEFQAHGLGVIEIAHFYLVKTPELLVMIVPIALLLALLYAVTHHARHQELTAIRSAGISLWRLARPYFVVGLALSLALFAMNEFWVPGSNESAERILKGKRSGESDEGIWLRNLNFQNARDGRIWNVEAFNLETHQMVNPHIEWEAGDGISRRLMAAAAERKEGVWIFFDVHEITYDLSRPEFHFETDRTEKLAVPEFTESPQQINSAIKIGQLSSARAARRVQFSVEEILHYLRWHPDLNARDEALLKTQLHARLAAPWTCLVVVLIALPFGAPSGRRNIFVGVAGGIFITFAFFILLRFGLALGTGGYLAPWLAAWLPNLVFGGAGIWLIQRVR